MRVPNDNLDVRELEHRYPDESIWRGVLALAIAFGILVILLFGLTRAWAGEDQVRAAVRKVTSAVADAGLPKSDYDPNSRAELEHGLMGSGGANHPTTHKDEKMEDAIRNGLSLSVSTCFNIYTQNPMGAEQDRRLERCLGRVFSGYKIAQEMMR